MICGWWHSLAKKLLSDVSNGTTPFAKGVARAVAGFDERLKSLQRLLEQLFNFMRQILLRIQVAHDPLLIHQHHERQTRHHEFLREFVVPTFAVKVLGPGDFFLPDELVQFPFLLVQADPDYFKAARMELLLGGLDVGQFPHADRARLWDATRETCGARLSWFRASADEYHG